MPIDLTRALGAAVAHLEGERDTIDRQIVVIQKISAAIPCDEDERGLEGFSSTAPTPDERSRPASSQSADEGVLGEAGADDGDAQVGPPGIELIDVLRANDQTSAPRCFLHRGALKRDEAPSKIVLHQNSGRSEAPASCGAADALLDVQHMRNHGCISVDPDENVFVSNRIEDHGVPAHEGEVLRLRYEPPRTTTNVQSSDMSASSWSASPASAARRKASSA
jgi:hypothetical protein